MNPRDWTACGAGYWLDGRMPSAVDRICNDTRRLSSGACFIAIGTEHADGHDFAAQAERAGASCAIVDHQLAGVAIPQFICADTLTCLREIASWSRNNFSGRIVGISGSIGKTSTKDILSLLLGVKNNKTLLNENGHLGVPITLTKFVNDEPIGIVELGVDCRGGMDELLELARPNDCIVTEIARIHLGNFGSEDAIAAEKVKLAEYVLERSSRCVLARELLRFECFRRLAKSCTIPSENPRDAVHFSVSHDASERQIDLSFDGKKHTFHVPNTMSAGTVKNLILALTYALSIGAESDCIGERLLEWQPSPMRGSLEMINGRTFFVDCYNANPTSFLDSLNNFDRLFRAGHRLFVVGSFIDAELGGYSIEENIRLGQNIPAHDGDTVISIGEHADMVRAGLLEASLPAGNILCLQNTSQAREFVQAHSGTVYLKGHRIYHLEELIC
jgi:UDP-N-acetylmuramoyl-tripeptide--D-alanyl-D-alanine ligase